MSKNTKTTSEGGQHDRFIETARALGCDEDPAAFDEKLKAVVGPKSKAVLGTSKKPKETE